MKKHLSFFAGVLTATIICLCTTTALAFSGTITLNGASVAFDAHTILYKGDNLTTESGASIPSTLVFTDEMGGTTCYIPADVFAKSLGLSSSWMEESETFRVRLSGDLAVYGLSTTSAGSNYDNLLEEITPVSAAGKQLLEERQYQNEEKIQSTLTPGQNDGNCVSITVTNNGTEPLKFGLGLQFSDGTNATRLTQVPAGETVTRTVRILDMKRALSDPVFFSLTGVKSEIDASVSAVQFKEAAK